MITISPTMSNLDYLRIAESKMSSLAIHNPESSEVQRMELVISDINSKLTIAEKDEYTVRKNTVASAAEIAAARNAMIKAMNENRDKPSI